MTVNGLKVTEFCGYGAGDAYVSVQTSDGSPLYVSGSLNEGSGLTAYDVGPSNNQNFFQIGGSPVDVDVAVVNSDSGSKVVRLDLHGEVYAGTCIFWGIAIPSS